MSTENVNITGNVIVKTASEWAADTTVYKKTKLLFSSDVFYAGTTFPKFKKGDDVNVWDDLDYFPDPSASDSIITKTEAEWSVDTNIYADDQILVSSDEMYFGTENPKIKIGNGIDPWDDLEYWALDLEVLSDTAANWAASSVVHSTGKILITVDLLYHGTDQPRHKIANGSDTWSNLNYVPAPILNYTRAERDAIASPQASDRIFNTTDQRMEYYDSFFGWMPVGLHNSSYPDWGYSYSTELVNVIGEPWSQGPENGGTPVNQILNSLSPLSLFGPSTSVNPTGGYAWKTGSYYRAASGKKRTETKVAMSILSNATDRYTFIFGYVTTTTALNQTDGMYFLYDEGGTSTGGSASPNWQCVCCRNGARTFLTTSIPVTDQTAASMQKLRIDDDGTGSNVKFYINGALVGTITTNVPNGAAVSLSHQVRISKSTGTNNRVSYVDYMTLMEKFNTPR